jgi:hypothetical protein
MEIGVLVWVRLIIAYLEIRPENINANTAQQCPMGVLSDELCKILVKDPFTIILSIWTAFQLTWVTMLLVVQLVQIARNLTTYESMRGHLNSHTPAEALNTFVTTGDISQDVAAGSAPTAGFGSGQDTGDATGARPPKQSLWDQWKKLLGLDTFVATALRGSRANEPRARGNPFSQGVVTNCRDFFCDASPVFKKKESGYARLGGERVDYTRLYELPKLRHQSSGGTAGRYEAVAAEEEGV